MYLFTCTEYLNVKNSEVNILKTINSIAMSIALPALMSSNVFAENSTSNQSYSIPSVEQTEFTIDYIEVDGYPHRVAYAGNPDGEPVILMTGFPEDDLPTARWFINEMTKHPEGDQYRYIMVHVPFLEEYAVPTYSRAPDYTIKYAELDGFDVKTHQPVRYKGVTPVDPRYDHENQAKVYYSIVRGGLGIEQAHFIGHDRGAVITDYMLGAHPEMALSYSRGSQAWTVYDSGWDKLAGDGVFIGPPHSLFATPGTAGALEKIFGEGYPFLLVTPTFVKKAATADKESELGQRWQAIQDMRNRPEHYLRVSREIFRQSNLEYEVGQRIDPNNANSILKTDFPMMHFQGEDEMIEAKDVPGVELLDEKTQTYRFADLPEKQGVLSHQVSEQPWFGKYNWYEGEIVNLNPETIFQSPNDDVWKENVEMHVRVQANGIYKTLDTLDGARFDRFALIPDAVHFSHIENPQACAWAVLDFIADTKQ